MIDLEAIKKRRASIDPVCWSNVQHNARFVIRDESNLMVALVDRPEISSFIMTAPADIKALIEEVDRLQDEITSQEWQN